jgi:hypothetical protein
MCELPRSSRSSCVRVGGGGGGGEDDEIASKFGRAFGRPRRVLNRWQSLVWIVTVEGQSNTVNPKGLQQRLHRRVSEYQLDNTTVPYLTFSFWESNGMRRNTRPPASQ